MNLKVFNTFIKHAHHSRNLTNLHFLLKYIVNKYNYKIRIIMSL